MLIIPIKLRNKNKNVFISKFLLNKFNIESIKSTKNVNSK